MTEAPRGWRLRLERSALAQLTWARILGFLREPEAMFWTFAFPVAMALALGIAFRQQGPQRVRVGVEDGPRAAATVQALAASRDLEVVTLAPGEGEKALRRGRIALLVRPMAPGAPLLIYDPQRPETRLAHLATLDALERAAGRADRVSAREDTRPRLGGRYIDFLIPGLIGLNLMGTGMWGVGFPIASARQQHLIKRLVATPMRRRDYLLAMMLGRMVWLLPEVVAVQGFGMLAFGVAMRGSWTAFALVSLVGALAFSALGLLVASRARTIEAVSGLMNLAMVPMWMLSGSFFSADRFPDAMQPFVRALPLTLINDALRAIANEGAGLHDVALRLLGLAAWCAVSFVLGLRLFRWE
jgi:ABC-2 type transport system permease protein